jgi:hypothetical protein
MANEDLIRCPLYDKRRGWCVHPEGDILSITVCCGGMLDFDHEVNYPTCANGFSITNEVKNAMV